MRGSFCCFALVLSGCGASFPPSAIGDEPEPADMPTESESRSIVLASTNAPVEAPPEIVSLRRRFARGDRYAFTSMATEGNELGLLLVETEGEREVVAVDDAGTATLSLRVEKAAIELDGRPLAGMVDERTLRAMRVRFAVSPLGAVVEAPQVSGARPRGATEQTALATELLSDLASEQVVFPEAAVAVGDRWASLVERELVLNGTTARCTMSLEHELTAVETHGADKIAIVRTAGTLTMPSTADDGATIEARGSVSGEHEIVLEDGHAARGSFDVDVTMTVALDAEPAASLRSHSQSTITLTRI